LNPPVRDTPSPYEAVGGRDGVARIVARFYDLMDGNPAFKDLRAMHAKDLAPMRESLSGFLTAWIGGPRDWFADHPGKCMMSVHAALPITCEAADQWVKAMAMALDESGIDMDLAARIGAAFSAMASNMARAG
jgi:hemoglobin